MYALWESFHISIRKPRFGATHFIPQVAVHGNKESYKVADNKICISDYRGRVRDQLRTNTEINADQLRIDIEVNAEINWKLQKFSKNAKKFDDFLLKFWDLNGAKDCKSCRSRKMLQNDALVVKIRVDAAENEPSNFWTFWLKKSE